MCGLYYCYVKHCCRDYRLRVDNIIVAFVHSLDPYERFCVELDLLLFVGSTGYHLPIEIIDVKWGRFDFVLEDEDEESEDF